MGSGRLRVGLVGAGRIGSLHAEHLAHRVPGVELAAVADASEEAARRCAERCGVPRVFSETSDLLAEPDLQAVVICSPTPTHAPLIEAAAAAGKHIFCEKPVDFSLRRIDQALAAVERARVKLQVGFNRRFDPSFRRARQAVRTGEVGEPHLLHIISRDPAPPSLEYVRASGGLFLDMTIHDFDMARYLVGDEVEEVFATGTVRVDPAIGEAGDIDTALTTLRFRNGTLASIDNSRRAVYGYDQRVEVLGSAGALRVDNRFPEEVTTYTAEEVRRGLPLHFFLERYAESFVEEMRAFVQAVLEDAPVPVGGEDARAATVLALAAQRSLASNHPVRCEEITAA